MNDAPKPKAIPDPPPMMQTQGLALDSNGDIWQYQGPAGMVKLGSLAEPEPEEPEPE